MVADIAKARGIAVEAFLDDNPVCEFVHHIPVRKGWNGESPLLIAIGNTAIRRRLVERLEFQSEWISLTHPSAIVCETSTIGEGSVVMHGAIIQTDVQIGRHCIVNTAASIDHDCKIGDYTHIAPRATLCGGVTVGECSWIGAGAVVIPGVTIGHNVVIGAGAVVIRDIPDSVVAYGNPCQVVRKLK